MSSSTSNNDTSKSAYDRGEVISSHKKVSTSCDQKDESCNNDGASNNTTSNSSSGIDTISDSLGRVDIPNDDDDDKMSISDEKLFQDPPPKEDCPICMLPMPFAPGLCGVGVTYMSCCGKSICCGCSMAEDEEMNEGNMKPWCALCRMPISSFRNSEEQLKRMRKRMELNDAEAFYSLGCSYRDRDYGLPQDFTIELWQKAVELGHSEAHHSLGRVYFYGQDVEEDMKKSIHHYTLAAIRGDENARYALGLIEEAKGNIKRAMKHYMIAARCGYEDSLKEVGNGYKAGHVTKDEYAKTLRAYQCSCDEMKSDKRAKAAAQR